MIIKRNLFGNPNIGVFAFATDDYCLVPNGLTKSDIKSIEEVLKVPCFELTIAQAHIIHTMSIGNRNGYLVPYTITDDELSLLKKIFDINIGRIKTEFTALGNHILCNDKAAIINPNLEKNQTKIIEDTLDVEVIRGRILGNEEPALVGSHAICSNKGVLAHVDATDETLEWLGAVLDVEVDIGTVNAGYPYTASGIIVNSNGAVVGDDTTGPEIVRIGQVFDIV
ncbi:MAG: translation initiation factor IF-6 [Candidatus Helarchaeota archaeon]